MKRPKIWLINTVFNELPSRYTARVVVGDDPWAELGESYIDLSDWVENQKAFWEAAMALTPPKPGRYAIRVRVVCHPTADPAHYLCQQWRYILGLKEYARIFAYLMGAPIPESGEFQNKVTAKTNPPATSSQPLTAKTNPPVTP